MLRKAREFDREVPLPPKAQRVLWGLGTLNVMAVAWMISAGDWLDRASPVSAVITLGGHHLLVLYLAASAFTLLTAVALLTGGFTAITNRVQPAVLSIAGAASVVALAGVLSVVILVAGGLLLIGFVGRLLLR